MTQTVVLHILPNVVSIDVTTEKLMAHLWFQLSYDETHVFSFFFFLLLYQFVTRI